MSFDTLMVLQPTNTDAEHYLSVPIKYVPHHLINIRTLLAGVLQQLSVRDAHDKNHKFVHLFPTDEHGFLHCVALLMMLYRSWKVISSFNVTHMSILMENH